MIKMVYCDYIAYLIHENLLANDADEQKLMRSTTPVKMDLSPEGWLNSTTKTMTVTDENGSKYKITVEQIDD